MVEFAPSAAGFLKYEAPRVPRQARLDTVNACNAHCQPCHLALQSKRGGLMSRQVIDMVLDDIACWPEYLQEIVPVGFGEFFLRHDWFEILQSIEKKLPHTRIALATNGSLLSDAVLTGLMQIGTLKWLNCSVNAFFKETYEAFTGLPSEVIERIGHAAERLRRERPDITTCASMIFSPLYQAEMERDLFVNFWRPRVSLVSINPANYCNSLLAPSIPTKLACRSVFDGLTVLHDGRVVTNCCYDSSGVLEVGHINTESLLEIWRGERIKRLWQLHNEGRRNEIELCAKCTFA